MTHLTAIILGVVEGATEFIPVSSSGHLIIARKFLSDSTTGLAFDAILQLATSCALLWYFRSNVISIIKSFFRLISGKAVEAKEKIMLWAIIFGTIPAIIFGLLLEKDMDTIFRNVNLVAISLIAGSILFWLAEKFAKQNKILTVGRGIVIGFFQCLALVPGVSRSGATISGGLLSGLTKEDSVRFSFVLSLPILFGAGFKKVFEVRHELFSSGYGTSLLLGSLTAFITGLIAINFLIKYLKNHSLNLFIWYRIILAVILFFMF